jgi:hypothetical protein
MEILAGEQSEKAGLGQGYNSEQEEFFGKCVRGEAEFVGNQQSQLTFNRSMSEESAASTLGFVVGAKARYSVRFGDIVSIFLRVCFCPDGLLLVGLLMPSGPTLAVASQVGNSPL